MAQYVDVSGTDPATGTGQVQEKVQQVADRVGEQAQRARGQAKGRVVQELDKRSSQVGDQINSTAEDVRTTAQELRRIGKDRPAQLAEQAAERMERVGGYLTHSGGQRLLNDIESFSRRQPWVVIAGGVALGLIASRFLKASSSERYRSQYDWDYPSSAAQPPLRSQLVSSYGSATSAETDPTPASDPLDLPSTAGASTATTDLPATSGSPTATTE